MENLWIVSLDNGVFGASADRQSRIVMVTKNDRDLLLLGLRTVDWIARSLGRDASACLELNVIRQRTKKNKLNRKQILFKHHFFRFQCFWNLNCVME
jgi:hypothetical protein